MAWCVLINIPIAILHTMTHTNWSRKVLLLGDSMGHSALICARFWGIHHWGVHSNSPIHIVPFIRVTKWMLRCNAVQGDCGTSTILPHKAWALMEDGKAAYRDWVACIKLTREYRSKCHIRRASTLRISFVYTYITIYKQLQSRKPIGEHNSHIPPLNYDSPLPGLSACATTNFDPSQLRSSLESVGVWKVTWYISTTNFSVKTRFEAL